MIDPKAVTRGLAHQREEQTCDHPVSEIIDRPHGSYCKACKQAVPPPEDPGKWPYALARLQSPVPIDKPFPMDWMGRVRKSVFPVFPSSS